MKQSFHKRVQAVNLSLLLLSKGILVSLQHISTLKPSELISLFRCMPAAPPHHSPGICCTVLLLLLSMEQNPQHPSVHAESHVAHGTTLLSSLPSGVLLWEGTQAPFLPSQFFTAIADLHILWVIQTRKVAGAGKSLKSNSFTSFELGRAPPTAIKTHLQSHDQSSKMTSNDVNRPSEETPQVQFKAKKKLVDLDERLTSFFFPVKL